MNKNLFMEEKMPEAVLFAYGDFYFNLETEKLDCKAEWQY